MSEGLHMSSIFHEAALEPLLHCKESIETVDFIKVLQLVSKRFITSLHELLTILESIEAEHISGQIFDAVA